MLCLALADRDPERGLITSLLAEYPVELVLLLGDLTGDRLMELAQFPDVCKLGVYGNHCYGSYLDDLGAHNLHGRIVRWRDMAFAGLEGCVRYKDHADHMYTQEQVARMLRDCGPVDVFLTHCPPAGINDHHDDPAHQGWTALTEYLHRHGPRYLLHGHTYPKADELVRQAGGTEIIYVFGHQLIELDIPSGGGIREPLPNADCPRDPLDVALSLPQDDPWPEEPSVVLVAD